MNCQDFNDIVDEYVDEALSATVQVAARQHLHGCDECRRVLQRHTMVGSSIRHALERASAGVSVRPGMQWDVLNALESERAALGGWRRAWQRITAICAQPIFARATVFAILLLISGLIFHGRVRWNSALQVSNNQAHFEECVIDVPMQTQTHVFQREGDRVVDAIGLRTGAGYARFPNEK